MKNGFFKVAAITPKLRVADPAFNVSALTEGAKKAAQKGARLAVFPELSVTAYTCGDLFENRTLLDAANTELLRFVDETKSLDCVTVVGMPVCYRNKLYNTGVFSYHGEILGVVPKVNIPTYAEFYEGRNFASASMDNGTNGLVELCGKAVPFGTDLLFSCKEIAGLKISCEICEDLWVPTPPSNRHAAAGATVICNLSASDETIGKASYRQKLVEMQSGRCICGYVYASAGEGESSTDLVFGGHNLIAECGTMLAESEPFEEGDGMILSEIDVEKLLHERRKQSTFPTADNCGYREISFSMPIAETELTRFVSSHPFTPDTSFERSKKCETILSIQTRGLCQRIERAYVQKLVIGISGGLDSTLALLVSARAMDYLKRPRTDIIAVTMPCFGTTKRTKNNATVLCEELGVDFRTVDIFDAVNIHFRDIGHDPNVRNAAYENCQARERTQILMDIANDCQGMVVGTGDLSELALGWATYNGDHMSMYGVNASIPKTLIRHIVSYCADEAEKAGKKALAASLCDILDTPVSPELLPADQNGEIAQKTEDLVGPYELHDFFLYYFIRFGFSPKKIFRLTKYAFRGEYDDTTILHWLETFCRRFFNQQFKRSCVPDGPKVGSVALSPRGDWRMPSDASWEAWKKEIEELKQGK